MSLDLPARLAAIRTLQQQAVEDLRRVLPLRAEAVRRLPPLVDAPSAFAWSTELGAARVEAASPALLGVEQYRVAAAAVEAVIVELWSLLGDLLQERLSC